MMAARFMLRAYDALCLALVALVLTALQPGVALAYVDPSVMTYTIQALAGVAVALSAVLGVALRRSRRVIMRLLHIDENANKEVEPPVSRVVSRADRAAVLAASIATFPPPITTTSPPRSKASFAFASLRNSTAV